MKREFVVALGGAAIVIAGLSGCSSEDKKSSSAGSEKATSSASGSASASPTAAAGTGGTKVTIDGKDQAVNGQVVCASMGGNTNIAIGEGATGIAAVVGEGDSPNVTSVALGNVNGVSLGFTAGAGGEAKAEKDGKTYKISGTATGIDMANPMSPVNKPFTIEVTCPN